MRWNITRGLFGFEPLYAGRSSMARIDSVLREIVVHHRFRSRNLEPVSTPHLWSLSLQFAIVAVGAMANSSATLLFLLTHLQTVDPAA